MGIEKVEVEGKYLERERLESKYVRKEVGEEQAE